MSPKVKFCRNLVAGAGVFISISGIFEIITNPAKWYDGLEMFSVAFLCLTIVRQVNRQEGDWHKETFVKKQ